LSRHPWGPPAAIELIRDSTTASQRANPQNIPDSVELGDDVKEYIVNRLKGME
jgi:hypothetical protein